MKFLLTCITVFALALPVSAQTLSDRIDQMEALNAKTAAKLTAIETRLAALEGNKTTPSGPIGQAIMQPATGPVSPMTYEQAYTEALASKVPLVVGVGTVPPRGYGYVACQCAANSSFQAGTITLCLPDGTGGMYVTSRLPATATASQIQQCLLSCMSASSGTATSCGGVTCNCVALMGACTCGPPAQQPMAYYGQPQYGQPYGGYQTQPIMYNAPMRGGLFRGGLFGGRGATTCGPGGCQ